MQRIVIREIDIPEAVSRRTEFNPQFMKVLVSHKVKSPGIVIIKMWREHLILHLLLNLLHRRSLDFERSIGMPPSHFQETAGDNVQNMTVCVRLAYLAAFTAGFHVSCECCWRLEYFETFQATMVRSLVKTGGQMHLQLVQVVVGFSGDL